MRNEKGFSLVELLIVVAIIAIIAAIAVPSLLTSRQAANEASAIQGLRTVGSAEIAFAATQNQQYTTLTSLYQGQFLDSRFSNPGDKINGYTYTSAANFGGTGAGLPLNTFGAPPSLFGVSASPAAGMGRFTYQIGADQVARFEGVVAGSSLPAGVAVGDPIGKTT